MSKFGEAFAAARKAGKKEFTFGGGRYNTRMREEENAKPAAKAAPKPAAAKLTAAPAPDRVGMANAGPKLANIKSGIDRGLGGIDKVIAAANAGAGGPEKARQANIAAQAARVAAAKKDYDPSSAGSNLKMALAKMGLKKGGKVKTATKMAKGGSVAKRADGIAKKGKTATRMVKMAKGGKMKGC